MFVFTPHTKLIYEYKVLFAANIADVGCLF